MKNIKKRLKMFSFEKNAVKIDDLSIEKTEFLIKDFLVKEAITMIYGAASQGKTWFMYALTKHLLDNNSIKKAFYIDMDNGKRQLKDRGADKNLLIYPNLRYIIKSTISISPFELIEEINKSAYGQNYKDILFVFDSTRDFVDTKNDKQAKLFMEKMKNIREAGGTVLLIHHATKSGRYIDGSAEFPRSADNVYELKQKIRSGSVLHYALNVENDRDPIKDMSFSVNTKTFTLKQEDDTFVKLTLQEEEFVKSILKELEIEPLNQTKLFAKIGKKRDDKTARKMLDKFTDIFWHFKINGREKLYYPGEKHAKN